MRRGTTLLLILLLGPWCTGADTAPKHSNDVKALIDGLADPDPAARQRAGEKLKELGFVARPALLEATQSDDPEIRARAGQLLLELPWHRPEDPPQVKALLADYGKQDTPKRKQTVEALHSLQQAPAMEALLRLLAEEPSGEVRWTIVGELRTMRNSPYLKRLQQLDTSRNDN